MRLAAWLVVAGVVLRALIPVGYMINTEAGTPGEPLLAVCPTGLSEPAQAIFDSSQPAPAHDHDNAAKAPCIFAAVAALAVSLTALDLTLAFFGQPRGWPLPPGIRRSQSRFPSANGARAPPLS